MCNVRRINTQQSGVRSFKIALKSGAAFFLSECRIGLGDSRKPTYSDSCPLRKIALSFKKIVFLKDKA